MPPGLGTGLRAAATQAVPGRAFAAVMRAVYPRLEPELACLATWAPRGGTAVDVGAWYGQRKPTIASVTPWSSSRRTPSTV